MSQPESIACPHCGQVFAVAPGQMAQYLGQTIECTRCRTPFTVGAAPASVTAAPPPPFPTSVPPSTLNPVQGTYGATAPMSAISIVALVFGLLSFCIPIIAAIVAIVCGIIGIVKTGPGQARGRGFAIAGLVLGGVGLFAAPCFLSVMLPSLNRAREAANRVKCASNLRQIGKACALYASSEKDGALPDTVDKLIGSGMLDPAAFICPSTHDTPSQAATPQLIAADLSAGGHDSYVYVGAGLKNSSPQSVIVAYEPIANHRNQGCNMLFGDGHVMFIPSARAQTMIAELQAGQNPPP